MKSTINMAKIFNLLSLDYFCNKRLLEHQSGISQRDERQHSRGVHGIRKISNRVDLVCLYMPPLHQ